MQYKSLLTYFALSILLFTVFNDRLYYVKAEIDVPENIDTLYYDIGYGFIDFFCVPVKNQKAEIWGHEVALSKIKKLGIKKFDADIITQNETDRRLLKTGFFETLPFNPSTMLQTQQVSLMMTIPLSLICAAFLTLVAFKARYLYDELQDSNKNPYILLCLFLFFAVYAFYTYPTIGADTIVQQRVVHGGFYEIVFSALYLILAHCSYIITSEPLVGLLGLHILLLSTLLYYSYLILCELQLKRIALFLTVCAAISPLSLAYVSFTEQRELLALLANMGLIIAIYGAVKNKPFFSKEYTLAFICACLATMLRYDSFGYIVAVALISTLTMRHRFKLVLGASLGAGAVIFAIGLSILWNNATHLQAHEYYSGIHRGIPFLFSNFGYLIKENKIDKSTEDLLSKYINIDKCREKWNGYSYESYSACSPGFNKELYQEYKPIVIKYAARHITEYIKTRYVFFIKSIHFCILSQTKYPTIVSNVKDIFSEKTVKNSQFFTSHKFIYSENSPTRQLLENYRHSNKIKLALLLISFVAAFYILAKKTERGTSFFRLLTILCVGPTFKFSVICLLAPFVSISYFTDVNLTLQILGPFLLIFAAKYQNIEHIRA